MFSLTERFITLPETKRLTVNLIVLGRPGAEGCYFLLER